MALAWRSVAVVAALVGALTGCARPPRWTTPDRPQEIEVQALLGAADPAAVFRPMHPAEVPSVPRPARWRPCCAFGSDLRVRIGFMAVPGVELRNVLDPDDLGHHYYDNGLLQTGKSFDENGHMEGERNGLVYTCRGGFVDVAHVRNWVDWGTYLATTIARNLENGSTTPMPSKGGQISVSVAPVDGEQILQLGRVRSAIPIAQWVAYQSSIWDEIATWFGWSHVPIFSEAASAFSPEDLYSNLIGLKIMAAVMAQGSARTEQLYNDSVDHWLDEVLRELGAVDRDLSREAVSAVDGFWWDSRRGVMNMELVRRRNMPIGMPVTPWLVPVARMSSNLRAACGDDPTPMPLQIAERDWSGRPLAERATVSVEPEPSIAKQEPFRSGPPRIDQSAFPLVIDFARGDAERRLGSRATQRD